VPHVTVTVPCRGRPPPSQCPVEGGFVARTPIQYFNVNVALLAGKPMSGKRRRTRALDPCKTRALELSKQWDPEVWPNASSPEPGRRLP
jgi:hypothetical protein